MICSRCGTTYYRGFCYHCENRRQWMQQQPRINSNFQRVKQPNEADMDWIEMFPQPKPMKQKKEKKPISLGDLLAEADRVLSVPKPPKKTERQKLAEKLAKMKARNQKAKEKVKKQKARAKWLARPKAKHDKQLAAWKLAVKTRAGWKCEVDGCEYGPKGLNAHHIYSVKNKSTRYLPDNGIALCPGHHTFNNQFSAHRTPTEFTMWLIKKRGQEWFDALTVMAHQIVTE